LIFLKASGFFIKTGPFIFFPQHFGNSLIQWRTFLHRYFIVGICCLDVSIITDLHT
jgi:cytochrome b subunit of formate dehydrogenase